MSSELPSLSSGFLHIGITVGGSLASLNPLVGAISEILNKISQINEQAQYNKKISRTILGRLLPVEAAIKFLLLKKEDFTEKLADLKYQEALHTLKNVLDKIKDFTEQVTQLRGLEKIIHAQSIEKTYKELMEEYESCLNALKFTMIIGFDELKRIENESLKNDIAETRKFLESYAKEQTDNVNIVYQEITQLKKKIDSADQIDIRVIEPPLLKELPCGNERRGKVFKMIYKDAIDVACKPIKQINEEVKELYSKLAIQRKLIDCPNVLKFYGLNLDSINWLAPEKMKYNPNSDDTKHDDPPYTP
ncbi:12341_t:CDS:2 [Racocetra persica]|uniref:12341_t:CDS:1 n=1 Tax=Racocetra persica TaxID=160502 RepID=A0ACA9RFL2_9GLOM|nr:12341_t:CDS:2 [Racocetra persica]